MLKNKKIILSSIAIVFALVVSAIFVNYTLANSDSRASLSDAGSGSDSNRLTGMSNIDLAIINSNDKDKIASGEDEFRIVQIVPDNYENLVKADDALKKASDDAKKLELERTGKNTTASSTEAGESTEDTSSDDSQASVDSASYLGSYVYSGEYFRLAVFNGYKTIDQNMASRAVSLTTRRAKYFNDLDNNTEAQDLLDNADFVYIWAGDYTDYQKGDISESLYNWLDAYATASSHPIAICKEALCVAKPDDVVGNNDTYRMGAFAYKLITKKGVARYENVLPTDSKFFQTLYQEASDNKKDDVTAAEYSLYRFIYNAETSKKSGGNEYIKNKTYFKWYTEDNSITQFFTGDVGSHTDSSYRPVGQMSGNTKNRIENQTNADKKDSEKVLFDNARILVISENTDNNTSPIFEKLKKDGINTAPVTTSDTNYAASYVFDANTGTWKSVQKAKNSDLTKYMYVDGVNNTGKNVASGADIYLINSNNLKDGLDSTKKTTITVQSFANSAFMDVRTKSISGVVNLTDAAKADIDMSKVFAYLVVKNKSQTKIIARDADGKAQYDEAGNLVYITDKVADYQVGIAGSTIAGSTSVDKISVPIEWVDEKIIEGYNDDGSPIYKTKKDENNKEILDDDGNPIYETQKVYSYSFDRLNPDYDYEVILGYKDADLDSEEELGALDSFNIGSADNTAKGSNGYSRKYDFSIGKGEGSGEYAEGYAYRKSASAATDYKVVNTLKEYKDNFAHINDIDYSTDERVTYVENADVCVTGTDLSQPEDVASYVKDKRTAYTTEEIGWQSEKRAIDLTSFDFIFIDDGAYTSEVGETVYNALDAAVVGGTYIIVSSNAGDPKRPAPGGSTPGSGGTVIQSPSAKAVADVINAGVYRDGADNKFRVLEIQPDYPIDLDVASANGGDTSPYTKRTDGSSITGSYYTIPSDVVCGKSKEELEEGTEYYQFDLTKAKIAHAVDGLDYGDIELTQVSTEQLIGMKEDILSTYDLVYIGGDISSMDRDPADMYKINKHPYGNSNPNYAYIGLPTFIMYYHTGILNYLSNKAEMYKTDRSSGISGSMMATPYVGGKYYTETYIAENGNDLTLNKYDELVEYVASNRPVIVSSELTSVYENMNRTVNGKKLSKAELMQGYWYRTDSDGKAVFERKNYYLDPSSRMYDLVEYVYNNKDKTSTSVLWGLDPDSTRYIDDKDCTYGTSLYSGEFDSNGNMVQSKLDVNAQKEAWYNNPADGNKVYKLYKSVMDKDTEASVNALIKGASQRVRLTVTKHPTTYKEGFENTYVRTNRLNFSFVFGQNDTIGSYTYNIYVDVDRNTKFADTDNVTELLASGSVSNGKTMNIPVALDEKYYGSASWYMQILDSAGNTVAGKTGLCKVVNNDTTTNRINVLQIQTMVDGQAASSWTATDSLYFDITSQTAHKIAKYNVYANMPDYDTSSPEQYKALGRHENRFGIYEFDMESDKDDYLSNIADALGDDYDINLDMVVATQKYASFVTEDKVSDSYDSLETMVNEAEKLEKGQKVDGCTKSEYVSMADTAYTAYNDAKRAVTEPKKALDDYLQGAIDHINSNKSPNDDNIIDWTSTYSAKYGGRKDSKNGDQMWHTFFGGFNSSITDKRIVELLNYCISTGDYSMMFWPMYSNNTDIFDNDEIGLVYGREFKDLFMAYRDAKDAELTAKDNYNKYLRRSYGKDFLKKMYSIVILGPSEGFGKYEVDFNKTMCNYLVDYVNNGGDLFTFHDTMTPFAQSGAVNLTKSLLDIVGMNRYHVNLENQSKSYTAVKTSSNLTKDALVYGLAENDDQDVYVKHLVTEASGQLEEGQLDASGSLYELLNIKNYTDDPNGLYRAIINSTDKEATILASQKDDPNGSLISGTLDSDGTIYVRRNADRGLAMQSNVPAGTMYYKEAKIVKGTAKAGQVYFDKSSEHYNENTVVHGRLYIDGSYVAKFDNSYFCLHTSAVADTSDVYYIDDTDVESVVFVDMSDTKNTVYDSSEMKKIPWDHSLKVYVGHTSTGTAKGYVRYTATTKSYILSTGVKSEGYFSEESAKAGTTGYIMASGAVQHKFVADDNTVKSGWFITKNVAKGKRCYEEIIGAEKHNYANSSGGISSAYFVAGSGNAGDYGYVMINDAQKMTYINDSGSYAEAYFTKKKAAKGDSGYIWTKAENISSVKGLIPNVARLNSSDRKAYMTNYAFNSAGGTDIVSSINANFATAKRNDSNIPSLNTVSYSSESGIYVSALSMTSLLSNGNNDDKTTVFPYVYALASSYTKSTEWSGDSKGADYSETMKAAQMNSGLVTMYPYNIGASLNIAGTHQQAYALDLESKNITVWYTLGGANNKTDAIKRSSKYAASPYDGMESYYIYTTSYGSGAITYCGSGHSSVTGKGKRNNDERKLFINVIVNSATAVPDSPVITCFEPTDTFAGDDELDKDMEASAAGGRKVYTKDVGTKSEYPEFDVEVKVPENTELSRVRVFYDLDNYTKKEDGSKVVDYTKAPEYNVGKKDENGNEITPEVQDVLIADYTGKNLTVENGYFRKNLRKTISELQLQNSYFAEYGGFETYIVVEATYNDGDGQKSIYSIIRVKVSDPLFNLTENDIASPVIGDFLPEKKLFNA